MQKSPKESTKTNKTSTSSEKQASRTWGLYQESIIFLYTSTKQLENEMKMSTFNRIKKKTLNYLGTILSTVKDIYSENYKMCLRLKKIK